jgi:hypothetical protein
MTFVLVPLSGPSNLASGPFKVCFLLHKQCTYIRKFAFKNFFNLRQTHRHLDLYSNFNSTKKLKILYVNLTLDCQHLFSQLIQAKK